MEATGVAQVGVVGIESVGHAAKPAQAVEAVDESRDALVFDPLELFGGGPVLGKVSDLGINEFLGLLQLVSRSDRDHHSKRSAEFTAALIGRNILSHPLPDHQVLVQAARFTASQDVGNQREFGIVLGKLGHGVPEPVRAVEFNPVSEGEVDGVGQGLAADAWRNRLHAAGNSAEVFGGQVEGFVEVAGQAQAGVARDVEAFEERFDVISAGGFHFLHDPNGHPTIRMLGRVHGLGEDAPNLSVGAIGIILAVLVFDHIFLNAQGVVGEGGQKMPHPIRLHGHGHFEVCRGEVDEVVGPITGS